jgi:beta-hydroxylase
MQPPGGASPLHLNPASQKKDKKPKAALPSWSEAPRRRAIRVLKQRGRPALNRFIARYSEVGDPVIFPAGSFEWESAVTDEWESIRDEALRVLDIREIVPAFQEVSPDQQRITTGNQWKTFWLRGFGHRSERACELCPTTDRVLNRIPGVVTAFFSILSPQSRIRAHHGVTKGMINCHLGLVVPDERSKCTISVGPEKFGWEPGELRIFDDTNRHKVRNKTDQDRIVLMIQFERPLRTPANWVRNLFFKGLGLTPYVRRARANQLEFEKRLAHHLKTQGLPSRDPDFTG